MNVQKRNDALIYCLSSGPTLPEWIGDRARRNLSKRDESIRRRIDLIQDFQMPSSSTNLVQSRDGRYIMAAGTYPPRVRCYDTSELTMKFERYLDAHVVDMVMLGEDYGKMAILMDDRTIAFHAHYGAHDSSVRIPTFGRGMAYEPTTCDLLLAAKGNQLYRLNLDEGRFSEPWTFEPTKASATCITVSPTHALAAVGCDDGIIRFWDNRSPDTLLKPFLSLDVQSATSGYGYADDTLLQHPGEITSIAHDPSGLYMAAGTAGGIVALYDVRSSRPLTVMEHKHGTGIHTLRFHPGSGCILSSDEKLVKIWRYRSLGENVRKTNRTHEKTGGALGSVLVNVEGNGRLATFIVAGDESDPTGNQSGLLLCATDQPKMDSYYVPYLGLAPKWCSFLDNITEELEERDVTREKAGDGGIGLVQDGEKEAIYENYKFVSRDEVDNLGISNLVGTPLLRGYMHGFFMDTNLYNRVRAVANPFEYEEYRKKKLKERLEAKRASRIAPKDTSSSSKKAQKTPVNAELASRLGNKAGDKTKAGKVADQVLTDSRFCSLFTNPDFQIDEDDENFKLRNPSGVAASKRRRNDLDSDSEGDDEYGTETETEPAGFSRIQGHEEESEPDAKNADYDSESEEDGFVGGKVRKALYLAIGFIWVIQGATYVDLLYFKCRSVVRCMNK
jgi:ribosome biogenesis protein ENP2